jgi:hypothetical protein
MRPEGKTPKNGKPTVGFAFMTMFQHTSFGPGLISKDTVTIIVHPPFSPDIAAANFYLFL